MDRSRDWATRIAHEASLHEDNCFLTLTYDDKYLPDDYSVSVRALQLFMKRLRKALNPPPKKGEDRPPFVRVRFFACGEYGDDNGRPHYHVILFGFSFPDRVPWRKSASGHLCYRSAFLESLWISKELDADGEWTGKWETTGHCEIGTVTRESGGYVARYVIKKINNDMAVDHYQRVHSVTGELCWVSPEFMVCSTNPGIGAGYSDKYGSDAFPSGFLVSDGKKVPIPRYYTRRITDAVDAVGIDPVSGVSQADLDKTRKAQTRMRNKPSFKANSTPERLAVREEVQRLRLKQLKRDLDAGNHNDP